MPALDRPPARCRRTARACGAGLAGIALALLVPSAAAAHTGDAVTPDSLWRSWSWDPWVLAGLWLSAWLYSRGLERLWRRAGVGRGVRRREAGCFAAGMAALVVALVSPLDALGGALFSAHMLQHVALMLVAAPLLVLGRPLVPFLWALPRPFRRTAGALARRPAVGAGWRALRHPLGAWTVHAAAIWIWHIPALYEATLRSELAHAAQHLSFFGTALLFWWTAVEFGRRRTYGYPAGTLYVFTTMVHGSLLGALLTFSMTPWYAVYSGRTEAWGLTPLEDQQLGGLVMWVPPGVVYVAAIVALLAAGLLGTGRRRPSIGRSRPEAGLAVSEARR